MSAITSTMQIRLLARAVVNVKVKRMYSGEPGSGAGQGGGGGGAIREAGGSFGKMEAAREDQYFYNKQKEQIQEMKKHLGDEIGHHEAAIKQHQEAINRHKEKLNKLDKTTK